MSPTEASTAAQTRNGLIAGISCYVLWGVIPIYWKLLGEVGSAEIIAHRIIWCFATTVAICAVTRAGLVSLLKQPRAWRILAPAAVIITANWSIYIYAVEIGRIVETSVGYYINPLVTILFGLVFFRERLTRIQTLAVALSAVGIFAFTWGYGRFPWISILLALTFGAYGAIKKKGGFPATPALAFENAVVLLPAIAFAVGLAQVTGTHAFLGDTASAHGWLLTLLLVGAGPITAVPLILFSHAANSIPLTALGFIQFISPTLSLLIGVFLYGEPFTAAHAVCLGCIWCGLALVTAERILRSQASS